MAASDYGMLISFGLLYIYIYIYIKVFYNNLFENWKLYTIKNSQCFDACSASYYLIHETTEMIKSLQHIHNKGLISYIKTLLKN